MISRFDVRLDISGQVPLDGPVYTAASVCCVDDPAVRLDPAVVVFAFPGGSYSRWYYDMRVPGRSGYSFAEQLARAGCVVVSCDHVGLGDSSPYQPFDELTRDVVVAANDATVRVALSRLAAGALADGLGTVATSFVIGVGHSIGAHLLTTQQARHRTFGAVAMLGWTQFLPAWAPARQQAYAAMRAEFPDSTWLPRERLRRFFYDDGVPSDVIRGRRGAGGAHVPLALPAGRVGTTARHRVAGGGPGDRRSGLPGLRIPRCRGQPTRRGRCLRRIP